MAWRKLRWLIVFLIAALGLAACETVVPAAPTLDPDALTQTVTVEDAQTGQLILIYPTSWFVDVTGSQVNFGDSEQTLQEALSDPPTQPGQFQVNVLPVPNQGLGFLDETLTSDSTPMEVLNFYAGLLAANNEQNPDEVLMLNSIQSYSANNREGAYVTGTGTVAGQSADVALVIIKIEGAGFVLFVIGAAEGEIAPHLAQVQEMTGLLNYIAVPVEQGSG